MAAAMKRGATRTMAIVLFAVLTAGLNLASAQNAMPAPKSRQSLVVLDSTVTILIDRNEPGPVMLAAEDLAGDLEKVFGKKPPIVNRTDDAGPVTILIGNKLELIAGLHPAPLTRPESFSISTTTVRWKKGAPTRVVLLTGADMRGTMYAIYQFSQEFLGTDPMYYWTDHEPAHKDVIELPAGLKKEYPAPVFKYRGFFINDEDLLTGWAPGEQKDHTGISLEVWNKIFETILRLKGNMVTPGTWIFPDEPQVKLASQRGLIITQHHATPLGVNVARWPENVPYSYTEHPEILERAWRNAVHAYTPDQEVLWTLGLRGLSDASYASSDPSVRGSDQKLGEVVTKALADQIGIVRAVRPNDRFILNLWQEGARLKKEGFLNIPPEVITVWADTGYGYMQDNGEVTNGQGAYFHVAMYNTMANQLTEMVPMERVNSELGRYIKAGATNYLLMNTSDIRPVAMMAEAVMEVGWAGVQPGTTANDMDYYRRWSAKEFGEQAASRIADIYQEYFHTPATRPNTNPPLPYGDNYYHTVARRLLMEYMVGSPIYGLPGQTPKWVMPGVASSHDPAADALIASARGEVDRCAEAQPRWDALWEKAEAAEPLVAPERRAYYHAHVLAMIAIDRESNRILSLVAQAVIAAENGNAAQARERAQQAMPAFNDIDKAEAAAEYGKWKNWYRGDWLTGIYRTRETVRDFLNYADDPLGHMAPPINWANWEAYYHIMHYEGDRAVDVH